MMKGLIIAASLLLVVADSAVILHHRIPPNHYLHNGQHYGYHQCPFYYLEAMDNVDSRDYYPDVVARHPLEITDGDGVKRLADYSFNDVEGRNRDESQSGAEAVIPNYRLFHFVLRLVRTMRRHFLPVYATHPDDISNIYAQYNEHELRRMRYVNLITKKEKKGYSLKGSL